MIRRHDLVRVFALTVFLFSLLVWLHSIVIQVTHPEWLYLPFSHVHVFPFNWRFDEVGMAAFAVAVVGFLIWQIELNMNAKTRYCRTCGSIIDDLKPVSAKKCKNEVIE